MIGFVGRLVPGKGGEILLDAAQKVTAVHPDATFVFVGEGPLRSEWEAIARRLGIAEKVIFTGVRNDMPGVYASFDMVVLPSFDEAMPMCVIEGMAAGKPVIATPVGATPELVLPGTTGLLVEPGDTSGLAAAILKLLANPEQTRQLGARAAQHVERRFSAAAMAQKYIDLYRLAPGSPVHSREPEMWFRADPRMSTQTTFVFRSSWRVEMKSATSVPWWNPCLRRISEASSGRPSLLTE